MEFRMLGSLEAEANGRCLPLGGPSEQKVLAMLLLNADRVVAVTHLVDTLWDDGPPVTAVKQAQNAIGRLRRQLVTSGEPDPVVTAHGGYRLRLDGNTLDARLFEMGVARAERAASAGDLAKAAALLESALDLWRGPSLTGLSGQAIQAAADAWDERRCMVQEAYYDHQLALGEHRRLLSDLRAAVSAYPLREKTAGQLLLALYRSGRQADALSVYSDLRDRLAADLGLDPCPELQRLHRQVLRSDPALASPGEARRTCTIGGPPHPRLVPRQLPAATPRFAGRAAELAELGTLLSTAADDQGGTTAIAAICGMAGVGKTALALHWAHQVADRFGDGQLHVNLRGFDPADIPATPAEAIRGFLDALGVPPERIPPSPDAQGGLYRSLLAGKRTLIVLDNARDEQQVRPLLPASPASLIIVTSRNQLTGLAVADAARLITLDVLSHEEAVDTLTARLGQARAAAEPGAAAAIASMCAHLPLALAIAAARTISRPGFPLAALAAELRDSASRLDALDAGDPAASVRAVFSWSYRQLSSEAGRIFRLLGLHPGPDISVPAAASLAGLTEPATRRLLRELTRAHLITEHAPGRYEFHDLLRAYAADQARECDSEPECAAAIGRVLDHYLHTACHGAFELRPYRERIFLAPPRLGVAPERPSGYQQAMAWFEGEHQVLLAVITLAESTRFDVHAWQIPWAMMPFLQTRGRFQEWASTQRAALAATTRLGDAAAQAASSRLLATACSDSGDHDQALGYFIASLQLYRRLGDRLGEAKVCKDLNVLAERQGRYAEALGYAKQALRLFQDIGHKTGEAELLNGVGWLHALRGDYPHARAFCQQALTHFAELGHHRPELEGYTWDSLGYAEHHLGNLSEAVACYQRALSLCREYGDRFIETEVLTHLGDARHAAGELPRAREAWQQAVVILEDLQHPNAGKVRVKLASTSDQNQDRLAERW